MERYVGKEIGFLTKLSSSGWKERVDTIPSLYVRIFTMHRYKAH